MGNIQPWRGASEQAGSDQPPGLLEQSRSLILGGKAATWLKKNEDKAFKTADDALSQAAETQALIQEILDDARAGNMPQVMGSEGPEDMGPLPFAERLVALNIQSLTAIEKAVSIRNKVASGGQNVITAALISSGTLQAQARRVGPQSGFKTARRVGVDAIPDGAIDV